jgi:hypothetical protein
MKKNFFLFSAILAFCIFYANRLNSMTAATKQKNKAPKAAQTKTNTQKTKTPQAQKIPAVAQSAMASGTIASQMPTAPTQAAPMQNTVQAQMRTPGLSTEESTNQKDSAPTATAQGSELKESQLGWPESIELEKTTPLIKKENQEIVHLFDEAERLYQEAQITVGNIQNMNNNFIKDFSENSGATDSFLEEASYKKGIIIEHLIESQNHSQP